MTTETKAQTTTADAAAYRAVELIYHSYLTGLILMLVSRAGTASAAEVVFRTFRRQQLARFLPGLKKLGLDKLPMRWPARSIIISRTRSGGEGRIRP